MLILSGFHLCWIENTFRAQGYQLFTADPGFEPPVWAHWLDLACLCSDHHLQYLKAARATAGFLCPVPPLLLALRIPPQPHRLYPPRQHNFRSSHTYPPENFWNHGSTCQLAFYWSPLLPMIDIMTLLSLTSVPIPVGQDWRFHAFIGSWNSNCSGLFSSLTAIILVVIIIWLYKFPNLNQCHTQPQPLDLCLLV